MNDYQVEIKSKSPLKGNIGIAPRRICSAFMNLLEGQFPIIDLHSTLKFRKAFDFAKQLNIHVNHLNRVIKTVKGKPTSTIIRERILAESKRLLQHTNWNISEVGYALGFTEVTHFNSFFRRNTATNPSQFRKSIIENS